MELGTSKVSQNEYKAINAVWGLSPLIVFVSDILAILLTLSLRR